MSRELRFRAYNNITKKMKGNVPIEFEIGKEQYEKQQRLRKLIPPAPTVWVEREFFRFCLSFHEKRNDWSQQDSFLRFEIIRSQLEIDDGNQITCCPARGRWLGSSKVSARDLYRNLPKRFFHDVVTLSQRGDAIMIDGRKIRAEWRDQ